MEKEYPLVSIAIITYNQKEYLRECIESCLAQDYPNFEIVVADDCSTDGTQDMLREYQAKYPGKFVLRLAEKNQGVTKNCNMAWKACKGYWIKSIAGDDKLQLNCLTIYIENVIKDNALTDLYFADMFVFNDENTIYKVLNEDKQFFKSSQMEKLKYLYRKNTLFAPTSFIKKSVLVDVGYADERFAMIEDHPLWLKCVKSNYQFKYIEKITVGYRVGDGLSQTSKKIGNSAFIESYFLQA